MSSNKVLITDHVDSLLLEGLQNSGFQCDYKPEITLRDVHAIISEYKGIIINSKIRVDQAFLDQATQLKFIARLGSGLEIIDLAYAKTKGVLIHRSPDGNCDAVAEHTLAMLLNLATKLRNADQEVRNKIWQREKNRGWELMNKTIGLLGFGYTGKAVATRLQGFNMSVLVYDKYLEGDYTKDFPWVRACSLEELLENVDILSLHLPLTVETINWLDQSFFESIKKSIVLLNTSRGEIVDTKALLWALKNGRLKAAGLDVFENEKPSTYTQEQTYLFNQLFQLDEVIFSPHVAGWTQESKKRLSQLLLDRILTNAPMI